MIVTLALCVLALRVAIPSGFMLDPDAHGWPRLIACPGAQAMPAPSPMAAMHHGAGHDRHQHRGGTDHPCDFAAASASVDVAAQPHDTVLPPVRSDARPVPLRAFARPGRGLAAPPPPKTGPPAFA